MPDNVKDNPVGKREALLADRLRLHKGYRQRFVKGRNRLCSCCPYIFSGSAEWDKSNPAFADWRDSATKYCDRCMVRKMTDFYNALDEHEFSEGMPEYQAIVNY